jgi:hypothetical protein
MTTPGVSVAGEPGTRRDPRVASAYLLASAGGFVLLGIVAVTIYENGQSDYGIGDRILAQSLGQLAYEGVSVGLLALASLMLIWFSAANPDHGSSNRGIGLKWANAALGCLVFGCGLAGVAGAGLFATLPSGGSEGQAWYVFQQIATGIGAALLGAAVAICATASARAS